MQISNWFCMSVMFVSRMRILPFMSGSASWANAHTYMYTKDVLYTHTYRYHAVPTFHSQFECTKLA